MDQSGLNEPKWTELDQSGSFFFFFFEKNVSVDQSGSNWTEIDQIGLKWVFIISFSLN